MGLHFGLFSSGPFSIKFVFVGDKGRGQGSPWGDVQVGLEIRRGASGRDAGYRGRAGSWVSGSQPRQDLSHGFPQAACPGGQPLIWVLDAFPLLQPAVSGVMSNTSAGTAVGYPAAQGHLLSRDEVPLPSLHHRTEVSRDPRLQRSQDPLTRPPTRTQESQFSKYL